MIRLQDIAEMAGVSRTTVSNVINGNTNMRTWNDFTMPLVLLSDESQQTLQLAQYVFKKQFFVDYNLAFASYLLVLIPVLLVYLFCQKWIMNGVVAGAGK